jgi:hypothetical protein
VARIHAQRLNRDVSRRIEQRLVVQVVEENAVRDPFRGSELDGLRVERPEKEQERGDDEGGGRSCR